MSFCIAETDGLHRDVGNTNAPDGPPSDPGLLVRTVHTERSKEFGGFSWDRPEF